ncbi:bacilysin biosynthesis oxidoreductase BacC [Aspergillus udagawae]|uniref:Bacilysin biosynthesis oxidoreductase BacC n=1 Tax=Aspergillus udagawae TaxID=91492 RepID=A0ABQ1BFC0_9EURO|nr:bacilysin biosynthesis oxidoreductase BacC [Aspergillus udagawae]GFG00988.1 bacilysin biosynthesis oxidoreductase BacC [Aspergillus udagawae]
MAHQVQGTAFITGGASGIGEATAHVLAKNGISALALLDVNPVLLEETKKQLLSEYAQLRVAVYQVDVRDEGAVEDAVRKTAEEFGQIDIGVNAAGISGKPGLSHDTELSDWQRVIDINQTGLWVCQRALIRQMLKQESRGAREGRGTIVNIASMYGVRAPSGGIAIAPYVAAKHAVVGLTKMDAKLYAAEGIRINAICPGFVETPMIRRSIESGALDSQVAMIPLGRPAMADEIANVILFLASPMSSYMCGEAMVVDGGLTV